MRKIKMEEKLKTLPVDERNHRRIYDLKMDHSVNIQDCLSNLTIIAGKCEELPKDINMEKLILVGSCIEDKKSFGCFVRGCTPNNVDIVRAILGDSGVKRTYATEETIE